MKRRKILKDLGFTLGGLLGQACFPDTVLAMPQKRRWGYIGDSAPEHWYDFSPDYQACRMGTRQSPVDIANGVLEGNPRDLVFRYGPVNVRVFDAGYNLQADVGVGLYLELGGDRYDLKQFHFHTPSEHHLAGHPCAMEIHFVHQNKQGNFVVVALFIHENQSQTDRGITDFEKDIGPVWNFFDGGNSTKFIPSIHLAKLLPRDRHYLQYSGSLTTPPCSETVEWILFQKPLTLSTEKIIRYKTRFPDNARPIQRTI